MILHEEKGIIFELYALWILITLIAITSLIIYDNNRKNNQWFAQNCFQGSESY